MVALERIERLRVQVHRSAKGSFGLGVVYPHRLVRSTFVAAGSLKGHVWLALTVGFTVYGQLMFKWRIDEAGDPPRSLDALVGYGVRVMLEPWMVSVLISVVFASLTWWATLRQFELSFAYPFMALSFVLVLVLSGVFFSEAITAPKVIGLALVVAGLVVGSQA